MTRTRALLPLVVLPALVASCTKKEEPAPVATTTTTTTTTTTVPATTPTPVPTPPPVWRSARWGMTKPEVLAAFPKEAQKLGKPADFAQPQMGSSLAAGSSDVSIPSYEADGQTFRVLFGFDADKLNRIHLAVPKPVAATCGDLERALTEKHGAPAKRTTVGTSLKGEEVAWNLPDQTIVLGCAGVASLGFLSATVDYLPPSTQPAAAP